MKKPLALPGTPVVAAVPPAAPRGVACCGKPVR